MAPEAVASSAFWVASPTPLVNSIVALSWPVSLPPIDAEANPPKLVSTTNPSASPSPSSIESCSSADVFSVS